MTQRLKKRKSASSKRASFKRKPKPKTRFGGFAVFGICVTLCGGGIFAGLEIQSIFSSGEKPLLTHAQASNRLSDKMINFN